jgi:hypothetical protein
MLCLYSVHQQTSTKQTTDDMQNVHCTSIHMYWYALDNFVDLCNFFFPTFLPYRSSVRRQLIITFRFITAKNVTSTSTPLLKTLVKRHIWTRDLGTQVPPDEFIPFLTNPVTPHGPCTIHLQHTHDWTNWENFHSHWHENWSCGSSGAEFLKSYSGRIKIQRP